MKTLTDVVAVVGTLALSIHAIPRLTRWSQYALCVLALAGAVALTKAFPL